MSEASTRRDAIQNAVVNAECDGPPFLCSEGIDCRCLVTILAVEAAIVEWEQSRVPSSEEIDAAARAEHAHHNSGVHFAQSPLSWETESESIRKWHIAGVTAALVAAAKVRADPARDFELGENT